MFKGQKCKGKQKSDDFVSCILKTSDEVVKCTVMIGKTKTNLPVKRTVELP